MIAIETGIPVPRRQSPNERYPWHELEVGSSFFVPNGKLRALAAGASRMKRKMKRDYLARAVEGGVRVWRTA